MNYKFKYAAGLPGYGINGKDGSIGFSGFSVYLTDYDGTQQIPSIESRIKLNETLIISESGVKIPGYPIRQYQNNDIFIDINGKIFTMRNIGQIGSQYQDSGLSFGTSNFLDKTLPSNVAGFSRYSNVKEDLVDHGRKLIDTVFGDNTGYYNLPAGPVYGIYPINYGKIFYSDVKPDGTNYNPYYLFNNDESDPKCALAMVRDVTNPLNKGQFRIGNIDGAGKIRDTDLNFDIRNLSQSRRSPGNNDVKSSILCEWDIDASCLFNNRKFDIIPTALNFSQDGSTVNITWNSLQILDISTYSSNINANLVIYPVSIGSVVNPLVYDKESGSLQDTSSKNKYKTNTLERINASGTINITGLDENLEYASYIEYEVNGWVRRTNKRTSVNAYPQFNIIKFDPVEYLHIDKNENIISVNISSNVSWSIISKPSWISSTNITSGQPGSTNVTIVVSAQPANSDERSGIIVFSGGGINRSFKISQNTSKIVSDPLWDSGWQRMNQGVAANQSDIRIRKVGKLCIIQGRFQNGKNMSPNATIASIPYNYIYKSGEPYNGTSHKISFLCGPQIEDNTDNYGNFGYVPTNAASGDSTSLYLKVDTHGYGGSFGSTYSINFSFFLD